MAAAPQRHRLKRLHGDLEELLAHPYPGVEPFIEDANINSFCLHLTPQSGPFAGLRLHFECQLPLSWPSLPPKVRSSVNIDHPNVFGSYICCDVLKLDGELEAGYRGGYTPAFTLRGLFLQFLSFFSSRTVDQDYGESVDIGEAISEDFMCGRHMLWHLRASSYQSRRCDCRPAALRALWYADTSEEIKLVVVPEESSTLSTKRNMLVQSDPSRQVFKVFQRNSRWMSTFDDIKHFNCKRCGYGTTYPHIASQTSAPSGVHLVHPFLTPPPTCLLPRLDDDVLGALMTHLPSETLLSFSSAYPRARRVLEDTHMLLQRELRCFFLRTPLRESILGIGISFDEETQALSSDFDWLSEEAFHSSNVRKSVQKKPFEFFLPLAFNQSHFERARPRVWTYLGALDKAIRQRQTRGPRLTISPNPLDSVRVIFRFMNQIVVSLMKSTDEVMECTSTRAASTLLLASEKAVIAYCQLYHLLTSIARVYPSVLSGASARLARFIKHPQARSKSAEPDLGELIIVASLVFGSAPVGKEPLTWSNLNGPFLEEVFIRNVRWVLQSAPELELLEVGRSPYRLMRTFTLAKTSLRLVMFQVAFLSEFVAAHAAHPTRLAENYGFPALPAPGEKSAPEKMVELIKEIYATSTWPQFFVRVKYENALQWGFDRLTRILRDCVKKSEERGYHRPLRFEQMGILRKLRQDRERSWVSARPVAR